MPEMALWRRFDRRLFRRASGVRCDASGGRLSALRVPVHIERYAEIAIGFCVRTAFLPRASNVEQNLQNDVDFKQARSSSQ
jgi:hypothetical protein